MLTLLVGLCLAVLLLEAQSQGVSTKTVALLGVLVAVNATLRFVEVAIPGPGGFSPIFPLIVLAGYVFGARFGFLLGVLTLLVSAILTGGVGPWLPYQMFAAGWVGLSAPLCRPLVRLLGGQGSKGEVAVLAVFGGYWGLLYGAIMNIWFWPYAIGPSQMYWQPGIGAWETLQRYLLFYAVTSLVWDLARMLGNMLLIAIGARCRAARAAPFPAALCLHLRSRLLLPWRCRKEPRWRNERVTGDPVSDASPSRLGVLGSRRGGGVDDNAQSLVRCCCSAIDRPGARTAAPYRR